uniref:Uncharacterized protein n=1 Tax=Moniliophthora roreri TaxID=221103 RepID=A0A0W0F827_MONRR
MCAVAVQDAD